MPSSDQRSLLLNTEIDFEPSWMQLEAIISDRGSKYSVSAARIECNDDIKQFLKKIKKDKKYAKATHHSYAARAMKNATVFDIKNDDGETGAGNVILRILQKKNIVNICVVVTRWYGGVKLHGDRFKHVQDATVILVDEYIKSL